MLCVIARIDEASRLRLLALQKEAEKLGIPPRHLHGHITLAVYAGEETEAFMASCRTIISHFRAFHVRYQHLAILRQPSTIVACPEKTGVLDEMQRVICAEWAETLNIWSQRDVWLPHTTLVQDTEADLDAALDGMKRVFEPFEARVSCVEFSAVRPDDYEIVDAVGLD